MEPARVRLHPGRQARRIFTGVSGPAGCRPGHQAEVWAAQCASWEKTPDHAINVFAIACARLYDEIARGDPQPWKKRFAAVAQDWAEYRSGMRSVLRR